MRRGLGLERQLSEDWPGTPSADGQEVYLAVSVSGLLPPEDPEAVLSGPWDPTTGGTIITGVYAQSPFEGHATYYIGLNDEREFRVTTLEDPSRIVIDLIRTPVETP